MSHWHINIFILGLKWRKGVEGKGYFVSMMEIGQFRHHDTLIVRMLFVLVKGVITLGRVPLYKCGFSFKMFVVIPVLKCCMYLCCGWRASESFLDVLKMDDKDRLARLSVQIQESKILSLVRNITVLCKPSLHCHG
jgi:hypothetical protein